MKSRFTKLLVLALLVLGLAFTSLAITTNNSYALSGSSFNPGRIIDDYVFYNNQSMTATQIQTFLDSKVPVCDTYGQQLSEFGGPDLNKDGKVQRWEWGKAYYNQTVFPCLRDYKQDTPQMEAASGLCGAIPASTGRTASQIVKSVADACNINPQVLVILLQKEQSLVTDTWPLTSQYENATGFACPDTAPCDPQYGGFFYQIYYAARQFKLYKLEHEQPTINGPTTYYDYNYRAGRTNTIYWHPDLSRCGSSQVYIENQATAGLYIYTPYRPNSAALNNLYGTGDSCSSYGNRNFWRMFTDWFGPTTGPSLAVGYLNTPKQPYSEEPTVASFWVRNISKHEINLGRLKVIARSATGVNYDFEGVDNVILKPGATFWYSKSNLLSQEGVYTFMIGCYQNNTWQSPPFAYYGVDKATTVTRAVMKRPTVTSGISGIPDSVHKNTNITPRFTVKNNSSLYPINIGRVKVAVRSATGKNYDFTSSPELVLQPGESYNYNATQALPYTGGYKFWIINYRADVGWSDTFPASDPSITIVRRVDKTVKDDVTMVSPLQVTAPDFRINKNVTASFTVKNYSDKAVNIGRVKAIVRDRLGYGYDFNSSPYITLQPGEEYTYSQSRAFAKAGVYGVEIQSYRLGYGWSKTYPASEENPMTRSTSVTIKDSVTLTKGLVVTPSSAKISTNVTASFTVKNYSDKAVNIGRVKAIVRDRLGYGYDFNSSPYITLQPGEEYTYSQSRAFAKAGVYGVEIQSYRLGYGWSKTYPASEENSLVRFTSLFAL